MRIPRIAIPVPTSTDLDYNRRSWPVYAEAVRRSGGEPVEVPLNQSPADTARLLANTHGILLPGSGADVNPQKYGQDAIEDCNPADLPRENVDELLLQDAHNMGKPIFAVCFGTQMLNVWRGGSLIQHLPGIPVNHSAGRAVAVAHSAIIAQPSLLGEIAHEELSGNKLPVNSSHHQAIDTPGDGLRVTARSSEDGVIEAVEGPPGKFLIGVQWHPERTYDESPASRALFDRFISEAATWSPKPPSAE